MKLYYIVPCAITRGRDGGGALRGGSGGGGVRPKTVSCMSVSIPLHSLVQRAEHVVRRPAETGTGVLLHVTTVITW